MFCWQDKKLTHQEHTTICFFWHGTQGTNHHRVALWNTLVCIKNLFQAISSTLQKPTHLTILGFFSLLLSLGLEVRPVTAPGIARYQFQSFINPKPNMSKLDLVHFWVVINQDKKVYFWIFVIHFKSSSYCKIDFLWLDSVWLLLFGHYQLITPKTKSDDPKFGWKSGKLIKTFTKLYLQFSGKGGFHVACSTQKSHSQEVLCQSFL